MPAHSSKRTARFRSFSATPTSPRRCRPARAGRFGSCSATSVAATAGRPRSSDDKLDHALDPRTVEGGKPPPDPADAISWLHGGAQRLVDAVELSGVETPVWTFLGPRPANWWIRRRLHEVAVHRADAAIALGAEFALAPDVAADAITEWLERVAIQAGSDGAALPLEGGNTLHLHATDPGLGEAGEWTIGVDEGRITWSHEHGKGTVALRGGATELLLAIAPGAARRHGHRAVRRRGRVAELAGPYAALGTAAGRTR